MKYKEMPAVFFSENRKKLLSFVEDKSLILFFSNSQMPRTGDQYFPFRQNANMFYMSGISLPNAILALCPHHPNPDFREILFVEQITQKKIIWDGCKHTVESLRNLSGIKTVFWTSDFETVLRNLAYHVHHIYLDMTESIKFHSEIKEQTSLYVDKIKSNYPLHYYHRLFPTLVDMRLIKSRCEIEQIKEACHITANAFNKILRFIKPDLWEYEVEAEIAHEFIRNRACCAFDSIVASGKNACTLHYIDNHSKCKDGDLLLLDFGAEYGNYASDLSRTIPVNGRFTERQKQIYDACARVYEYAKTLFVPGMTISKVYKKVSIVMQQELIDLGLFSKADLENQSSDYELMKQYFPHNISHFIGLDVHDVGSVDIIFEDGMILSCEPGIYIPEEKTGVRIETTIMVAHHPVDLMPDIPFYSDDIEQIMIND
ncbi:MAG: aminopeptidase P N-terminal domain-containing protein [Bacteroidales bacterium]|jgi:Xaa-Pro aminopeptidase|nr:aminopeptidase P N-terminal domain-containing protein [Bacteroidales bacterium]